MSLYKFLIKNKAGGSFELLGATNRTFATYLNKSGDASFTLDLLDPTLVSGMIALRYSELWVYRAGVLVWAGEVVGEQTSGATDSITYAAKGWSDLLSFREVGTNQAPVTFTGVDASQIAWSCVNGAFGITQGSLATASAHDRTNLQYIPVKDVLDGLSNDHISDGIDYEITPDKKLNTYYPAKGSVKDQIQLTYGINLLDFTLSEDATGMVNEVTALGAGDGVSMLTATSDSPSWMATTYGLRQTSLAFKDVSEPATLAGHASGELAQRQIPQWVLTVVSDGSLVPYASYTEGDTIRVKIDRGLCQIDGRYRVYGRKTTISDEDQERVETYCNPS